MTSRADLEALAARVEAAEAADRELSTEIDQIICPDRVKGVAKMDWWRFIPHYTASIDAALQLYLRIPERVPSNPRLATAEALRQRAEASHAAD